MAKRLTNALGVDIGSQTIKVAEVRLQGNTPVVTALGQAMTPPGAVDHIGVHDVDAVSAVLKDLVTSTGASIGDVVISVAGQGSVLVRVLEVPNMPANELKQHMDWEIRRNIPFAEQTVVSDYQSFPPATSDAQNLEVVMAISPESASRSLTELVKKIGKKARAIDVEPLALARGLDRSYGDEMRDKTVCVIEIGHKTTSINIYKNGQLKLPRQVPLGGENFTKAIADNLSISYDEAEQMKIREGEIPADASTMASADPFGGGATAAFEPYNPFADPSEAPAEDVVADDTGEPMSAEPVADEPVATSDTGNDSQNLHVYNAMAAVVDEFVAEVRRSVEYYRSKGGEVDTLLLCGGGAKLRGLPALLESSIGLTAGMYDPTKGISVNARNATEDTKEEYAVAIGTGLHVAY